MKPTKLVAITLVIAVIAILLAVPRLGRADNAPHTWSDAEIAYFCTLPLAEARIDDCTLPARPTLQKLVRLRKKK